MDTETQSDSNEENLQHILEAVNKLGMEISVINANGYILMTMNPFQNLTNTEIISTFQRGNNSMTQEENSEKEVSDEDLVAPMTEAIKFFKKAYEAFET